MKHYFIYLITFAGIPATIQLHGKSSGTTKLAPIITLSLMVPSPNMKTLSPINTL